MPLFPEATALFDLSYQRAVGYNYEGNKNLYASKQGKGFWMPVNTMAATRSIGRRPKSAKARNRDRSCAGGAAHAMGI